MAINYGLLQQIQPPKVVGSIPVQPQQPVDGGLLSGAIQGLQAGQNMAAQRQGMAAQQQQMEQSKQLFPSELQRSQQAAESGAIDLQNKRTAQEDANVLRAAAAQSEDAWFEQLQKISPAQALEARKQKQEIQKTAQEVITSQVQADLYRSQTKKTEAEVNKLVMGEYNNTMYTIGNLAQNALAQRSPEETQKYWQAGLQFMPEEYQKRLPPKLDPITGQNLVNIGRMSEANLIESQSDKNTTSTQKDLRRIGQLKQMQQNGQLTESQQIELKGLEDVQSSRARGSQQMTPGQKVSSEVSTDSLKKGQEEANASRNIIQNLNSLEALDKGDKIQSGSLANFKIGAAKGASAVGSLFGVNINPNTGDSEAFDSIAKNLQLDYQTKLKGATSDRDLATVGKAVPQLTNTKEGRQLMYNWGKALATSKIQFENFRNEWAEQHNGSLSGADDAWNSFLESGERVDSKTGKFNLDSYSRKQWKPFLDENYQAPKKSEATQPNNQTSQFQEGKIYTDANGNRAKFVNGQFQEL